MTNDVDGLWSEETQAIDLIDSGKVKVQTMTGGEFLKELEEKVINFFHWYNGQSPLAHCCMQIHPEQFWGNVKGVCICGRTERPKWVIEARRKAEE